MRARNIKPGFFSNDELAECTALARLLYIGLWCCADREGRMEDRPRKIKGCVFPFDDSSECNIEQLLGELISAGFIVRYEVDGRKYIDIPTFSQHQRPHKHEKKSDVPRRVESTTKVRRRKRQGDAKDALIPDMRNDDRGMMNDECSAPGNGSDLFDQFWRAFPARRRQDKEAAHKAWKVAIKKADPETIIAAVVEYAASDVGQGEYVKGPAPWLNKGCWADDRAAWQNHKPQLQEVPF